jgi:hypothetical protein
MHSTVAVLALWTVALRRAQIGLAVTHETCMSFFRQTRSSPANLHLVALDHYYCHRGSKKVYKWSAYI